MNLLPLIRWDSISNPAILTVPAVGAMKPVSSFIVVDFPAPLGPRKPHTCFLGTENVTSRTAANGP